MLILSRRPGEEILIGDDIRIVVVAIRGDGKVRIGIEAPPEVTILRCELLEPVDAWRDVGGEG